MVPALCRNHEWRGQGIAYPVLEGKVAIVTGAGQGMGEVTAKLFAASGAKVVVADFNRVTGQKVVDEIIAEGGEAYYDRLMSIDLKGTALCLKHELAQMIRQGHGGSIVNISSVSGFRPQVTTFAYTAAKAGVVGMTKTAAMENGPHNIRVNSVAPGAIDTPMLRAALVQFGLDPNHYSKQMSNLGRFAEASEVAEASLWLCSDASSYVTGTVLHVDGGFVDAPPLV